MNAVDGSKDKYAAQANIYATFRPPYPASLVQQFVCSIPESQRRYALDIAAGSGQLSGPLADHFAVVVALDKSEGQLKHGPRIPNIIYHSGLATNLKSATEEITGATHFDAITCAQAYHWFIAEGIDKFVLQEACRVLHPGSKLGIFGYGVCTITSSSLLQEMFYNFYYEDLGSNLEPSSPDCYWEVDRKLLDSGMQDFPTHGLVEIEARHERIERRKMSVHAFLNYVRTFSGLQNLRQKAAMQGDCDPMETLQAQFEANSREDEVLDVDFPFFLIILRPVKS